MSVKCVRSYTSSLDGGAKRLHVHFLVVSSQNWGPFLKDMAVT